MNVLVACEYSAIVRDAFLRRGHRAYSCDLLPTEGDDNWHVQGDVQPVLWQRRWDLIIAHPPCTRLANSGVRWLHEREGLWQELNDDTWFFRMFLRHPCPRICVENPIPHRYAIDRIGRKYDQIIQPWQFGHGETKSICLWLKGLPKLRPTKVVEGREQRIWRMSPGADRAKERSRFYPGIAEAMAQQWG